jgi:hypothetical protein
MVLWDMLPRVILIDEDEGMAKILAMKTMSKGAPTILQPTIPQTF